jgi:hypothetical protein
MTTTATDKNKSSRGDVVVVVALVVLAAALFYGLPKGYWRGDDPAILWHAMNSKGLNAFYNPLDWQKLSPNNLTPWITFSFKIDLWLAGLSPQVLYIHSIVSLMLVVVAAYALNRHWMSPLWAFLSVCLFLTGAPTASVTELLMTRHYMDGLLFALISVIAFIQALRRRQIRWAVLGAIFYALAATAKEIYVPLVLVILFFPSVGSHKLRLRLAAPYVVVSLFYIVWRGFMLESVIGGYAEYDAIVSSKTLTEIISALYRFPGYFFGPHWIAPTLIVFASMGVAAVKRPVYIPVFSILAVCVIAPLVPLVSFPGISGPDRYLFMVWFAICLTGTLAIHATCATFTTSQLLKNLVGIVAVLVVGAVSYFNTLELRKSLSAGYREFDIQGRFYFEADQRQGFIPSQNLLNTFWYVTNLCEIKKRLGLECPTALIKSVVTEHPIERLYAYDPLSQKMVDISERLQSELKQIESIDTSRPLHATISLDKGVGRWNLGPYDQGKYFFSSPQIGRYQVPKHGSTKNPISHLSLYVQYESPEGWTTSSPILVVEIDKPIEWKR